MSSSPKFIISMLSIVFSTISVIINDFHIPPHFLAISVLPRGRGYSGYCKCTSDVLIDLQGSEHGRIGTDIWTDASIRTCVLDGYGRIKVCKNELFLRFT